MGLILLYIKKAEKIFCGLINLGETQKEKDFLKKEEPTLLSPKKFIRKITEEVMSGEENKVNL